MTPRLVVRPPAEADIAEAPLWYDARSSGLGTELLRSLDACFSEVLRSPQRFPLVYKTTRRALLRRFPYTLYFVLTATEVQVIACMHVKRDPRRWQRRRG